MALVLPEEVGHASQSVTFTQGQGFIGGGGGGPGIPPTPQEILQQQLNYRRKLHYNTMFLFFKYFIKVNLR